MTLPLAGVRVVELAEQAFVPSAGAALADFGAEVIKIERPAGDALRRNISSGMVPSANGYDYLFELINRNKRGIALDITEPGGRQAYERLIASADVYLTSQLPQVQRKLRTTPQDLFAIKPSLVFARGNGYGQRGPDAETGGYDSVSYWQRGGVSHLVSDPDADQPAGQRPGLGDLPSGMFLVGGVCAALVKAARTGQGSVVDVALLNSATWTLGPDLAYASVTGEQMRLATRPRSPLTYTYKTSDGRFVGLMMINESRYWRACTTALGLDELGARFADDTERRAHWAQLREPFERAVAGLTCEEVGARLTAASCIHAFFATPVDVLADPSVQANGFLMEHPGHPTLRLSAAPVQFDDRFPEVRLAGPGIGEHTTEILTSLGYSPAEVVELVASGAAVKPSTKPE